MKCLIVSPQAGMCNRFRVLCSALLLARLSGRRLYHCWAQEAPLEADIDIVRHMRAASLSTFFLEAPGLPYRDVGAAADIDQVFSEWEPGDYWYPLQSSAIRRCGWRGSVDVERASADAILNSQANTVLLETSLCLKPSFMTQGEFESALTDIYRDHFKPQPLFKGAVDRFARQGPYVGVHIRRRDHLKHCPDAAIGAKSWERIIRREVSSGEALCICSDDLPFAASIARLLPEYRVLRVEEAFPHAPQLQAFLEFLCLSMALRIYGTAGSSFSREAARFGGRGFVHCSVKQPKNIWEKLWGYLGMNAEQIECCNMPAPRS